MTTYLRGFSRPSVLLFLTSILLLGVAGCDNSTTINDAQIIADAAWKPDGSGMVGLIERTTQATLAANGYDVYDLYRIGSDGNIGERIPLPSPVYQGFFPAIFMSDDGRSALVESASNVVRVDLPSNGSTLVVESAYLLGASPDLKYVVTTTDGSASRTKLCTIYDISTMPARRVTQFNAVNVSNNRALWISGDRFIMTHFDTTGTAFLSIYDTTGHVIQSIENAEASLHASAYAAGSNEMFVRDKLNHIVRVNLETGVRTSVVGTASVNSMDVTRDGSLLAYTTVDTTGTRIIYVENVATRDQKQVGTGGLEVFLNPQGNRLAYVRYRDAYNDDIQMVDVTLP